MEDNTFHVGDWGILFKFRAINRDTNLPMNISTATEKYLFFKKPSGASFFRVATFTTDGSDGYIEYVSVDGDLDTVGEWSVQGYVVMPDAAMRLEAASFKVKAALFDADLIP